jgi:hypothetical protein
MDLSALALAQALALPPTLVLELGLVREPVRWVL